MCVPVWYWYCPCCGWDDRPAALYIRDYFCPKCCSQLLPFYGS